MHLKFFLGFCLLSTHLYIARYFYNHPREVSFWQFGEIFRQIRIVKRDHNLRYDCKMKIMIYNTQLGINLAKFSIDTRFESWDNGVKNSSHQKMALHFQKMMECWLLNDHKNINSRIQYISTTRF